MIRVHLTGGAPWGFRLQGGVGTGLPVAISKVRRRSKAHLAKLQEGDEIITINGRSCRGISRDVAMTYIDNATESLDLEIVRGEQNNNLANTANDIRQQQPTSMTITQEPGAVTESQSTRKRTVIHITTGGGKSQSEITKSVVEKHGDDVTTDTTHETRTETTAVLDSPAETNNAIINGDESGTLEFKFQVPKFSPAPLGTTAKPGVWSPGNQQKHEEPNYNKSSTVSYQETVTTSHDTAPTRAKAPTPRFHASPSTTAAPKQGVWQPGGGSSTPKIGQEVEITFSPGALSLNSGPSEVPVTPITQATPNEIHRLEETPEVEHEEEPSQETESKDNPSILDDPSLILAGFGPKRDPANIEVKKRAKSKIEMHRPFSYHGYESKTEVDLTKEDARKICKQIADLLMFPSNKQARGAKMFAKRRKKAAKYTVEGFGQRPIEDYDTESMPDLYQPTTPGTPFQPMTPQPPPPPPIMSIHDEDYDPSRLFQFKLPTRPISPRNTAAPVTPKAPRTITIEPTNFNINLRDKTKCEHVAVTPDLCGMLAQDLKTRGGRASAMFAKRQKRVQKFVVDETNVKAPQAIHDDDDDEPDGVTSKGGIKVTLKSISKTKPSEQRPATAKHKTPWEAAMESPLGSVDQAFEHLDTGPTVVEVSLPKHMISSPSRKMPPEPKPKPSPSWASQSPAVQSAPKPSSVPAIRPKFKASGPVQNESSGNSFNQDYNPKIKGWSPVGSSGDRTPGSPAALDYSGSADPTPAVPLVLPKQSKSPSPSFMDYNPKPRAWTPGSANQSTTPDFRPIKPAFNKPIQTEMLESEDL
ncbi:uncharacterized protein LOC144451965 isoform X2 [Glandiceps talaboti]